MYFFVRMKNNMHILYHYLYRETLVFLDDYTNTFIDSLFWPLLGAFVFGYIFPHMGMPASYGSMISVGGVLAICFYVCCILGEMLSTDFDGTRKIEFELTLPVTPSFVIVKNALMVALRSFFMVAPLPFICKLVLYDRFDFTHFSFIKYVISFLLANITFGFFAMMIAGLVPSKHRTHFRVRVVDTMFFLGCFMFRWEDVHKVFPRISFLWLLNPIVHVMESSRVAFFGQEGFLPFWVSCFVLLVQTSVFYYAATWGWKRRLDLITKY